MNLQRFAHSYQFTTYALGRKRKFFDARFNFKKCKNSDIGHFTATQVFSLMKACNCSKNKTFHEVTQNILLSGDVELNPGPTLKKSPPRTKCIITIKNFGNEIASLWSHPS